MSAQRSHARSDSPQFATRPCGHRVPRNRPRCPFCQPPRLSVVPLVDALKHRADVVGGIRPMSVEIATRLGMEYESVARQVHKMFSGQTKTISMYLADSYCVAIGDMPASLWGQAWDDANPIEPYGDEASEAW